MNKMLLNAPATNPMGITIARSISSRVELDHIRGTAHKTYSAPRWVRILYRLAFQAPFPYERNPDAIAAARHRREIAGLLTSHWFGVDLVSPVLDVRLHEGGQVGFVTRLVRGDAPSDSRHARRFLGQLDRHFLAAGLPTWQVTPYNPRATGNLIAARDGVYRVIDLESNLVAPLVPLSGIIGLIRQGAFPVFDDIDIAKLRRYTDANAAAIRGTLGDEGFDSLTRSADAYDAAATRWHAGEPRIISRALKFALKLVDVPSWVRGLRRMTANSDAAAQRVVTDGIDQWTAEGQITTEQATDLHARAQQPEVTSALAHLGAHMLMSIPLRFPLGSIARPAWTLAMRAAAEWRALIGRGSAKSARREHTLAVAAASAVPGFGAAAYMLSEPLRNNRALAVIAADRPMRKLPGRLYHRLHLAPFMVWHARVDRDRISRPSLRDIARETVARLAALRPAGPWVGAVLLANLSIVLAGGIAYVAYDSRAIVDEGGIMNTVDAIELAIAGFVGLATWRAFWRSSADDAPLAQRAGILFWAIAGAGLMFAAADDYFELHERLGDWMAAHAMSLPLMTNTADDVITLSVGITALGVLYVFREELLAPRRSSTLLLLGAGAAALMVATDVYGHGAIRPLEFPSQVTAVGLLLSAFVARYVEVVRRSPSPAEAPVVTGTAAHPAAVAA